MTTTYDFENYFEHKTLDKVFGEPTTHSLHQLFKQLKRNARSVPSTLGGGQYGHLFMVLTPEEWTALPESTPVIPPEDPDPFALQRGTPAVEIAVNQKTHEEEKKKYNKFQALKRILRNQLVSAIQPEYLDPIRCEITDMVNEEVPEIIKFLQNAYGKMSVNEIEEETARIRNFAYDPTTSINILLTAIQKHADILKIAGAELRDTQIQTLAYYLLNKYDLFRDALKAWNKVPTPKTWDMMKTHMRSEYNMLKEVNALSIQESALNTTDIMNELKNQQEELLDSAEKRFKTNLTEVMNMAISDVESKNDTSEQINNAAEINTLKQEIKKLTTQLQNSRGRAISHFDAISTSQGPRNFLPNQRYRRNNFQRQFYCWTHGAGHSGWNCKNPAEGHQPSATFNNRKGGSNFGCYTSKPRRFQNNYNREKSSENTPPMNQAQQN